MAGWTLHTGAAVALPRENIDTDQLIPARFMSVPRSQGYGPYLLHDLRRDEDGNQRPDFPLNTHADATVLIAGANFGCGSSREAAVYALVDAGFAAVFAPSFGDIFASNAVNNGLLPARIATDTHAALLQTVGESCAVSVDLETNHARFGDFEVAFALDDTWRTKLINGWDDIDLTQQHAAAITSFRSQYVQSKQWAAIPSTG